MTIPVNGQLVMAEFALNSCWVAVLPYGLTPNDIITKITARMVMMCYSNANGK